MIERKLASIQLIANLEPIENADAIERATILGWQCVVKKGTFSIGDFCVYFEIDSLLPVKPEYEFLRKNSFNTRLNGFRIRTVKLRGQISQGLALHIEETHLVFAEEDIVEGKDLTELLEVRKYEPEIHPSLQGNVSGNFPSFFPKTDEERIQNVPGVLTRYPDTKFYVTEKVDGTSSSFYLKDDHFGVCGRNFEFKPDVVNTYWEVAKKYDVENKLRVYGKNIAIQGEIVGPSIQKNKYAFSEFKLFIYNAYDIDNSTNFDYTSVVVLCNTLGLDMVPIIEDNFTLPTTMEEIIAYSQSKSILNPNIQREGVVVRGMINLTDYQLGRLSFKVINPTFLLKYEE